MLGPSAVGAGEAGDEVRAVPGTIALGQAAVPARHPAAAAQARGTFLALEKGATAVGGEVAEGDDVGRGGLGQRDHLGIRDKGGERRTWPRRWGGGPTADRAALPEARPSAARGWQGGGKGPSRLGR